jgi:two-component system phosphate regulon sensor histidine kinase PhoR
VLIIGALAAWLLARSLSRPLGQLTAAAHRVANGAYEDAPLDVRRRDEIGVLAQAFATMRERVAAATSALRNERDVLDAVLQSAGDGIVMLDPDGLVIVANERWSELLGGTAGLMAAADLQQIGRSGDDASFAAVVRTWLADPACQTVADFERFGANPAAYRRFRCYTAPVRGRDGVAIGRILVLRDVTRESEAERMRTALVANVSHELRSPLTAIKGYVDTLLQGAPWEADTEREFLEIIGAAADKLASLVENLLDAAKMDAGVLSLEREPVRVDRIAQEVVGRLQPLTPHHDLTVVTTAHPSLALADPLRVEQVLTNLVENAIKYAPDGGPVTVQVEGGDELTVRVHDQGIGIAPEEVVHLFERFYRADTSLARTTRGLGLGLYICRSLVEAHGGRIWVESAGPGHGSVFAFTLPGLTGLAEPDRGVAVAAGRPG